ncbi:MAG TPA: hypothetical protein ENF78_01045 [Candidatus Bathyarchaeota archaeon]|nr:hypothetical protein [Candidatus Bathyarchaeota archaeon]
MASGVVRELLEALGASAIAAFVGLSLYLEVGQALGLGPVELMALSLGTCWAHDLAHRLYLVLTDLRGRFRISLTGSAFSLLIAGIQNGISALLMAAAGPGDLPRLVPYRFLAPGAVTLEGPGEKARLGKLASAGPTANLAISSLLLLLAPFLTNPTVHELALLAAALNAYTALTALLPLAFCDGLTIYWWSRRAWLGLLLASILLIVLSNYAFLML